MNRLYDWLWLLSWIVWGVGALMLAATSELEGWMIAVWLGAFGALAVWSEILRRPS